MMKPQSFSATLGHALACGVDDAQPVDDGEDDEKAEADEQVLQRKGKTEPQDAQEDPAARRDVRGRKVEGEPPAADDQQGEDDAERLGQDGRNGGAGCAHPQAGDEEEIAEDVEDGGDEHGDEGHLRVADAAEDAAQQVVGDDEDRARTADADVGDRLCRGFGGGVERGRHGTGQRLHQHGEHQPQEGEKEDRSADDRAAVSLFAAAHGLPQQDSGTRRKLGDDHGDAHHHLGADGHG